MIRAKGGTRKEVLAKRVLSRMGKGGKGGKEEGADLRCNRVEVTLVMVVGVAGSRTDLKGLSRVMGEECYEVGKSS